MRRVCKITSPPTKELSCPTTTQPGLHVTKREGVSGGVERGDHDHACLLQYRRGYASSSVPVPHVSSRRMREDGWMDDIGYHAAVNVCSSVFCVVPTRGGSEECLLWKMCLV